MSLNAKRTILSHIYRNHYPSDKTHSCIRFKTAHLKVLILLLPDEKDHCLYFVGLCWFTCIWQWGFQHATKWHCLLSCKGERYAGIKARCQHSGHFKSLLRICSRCQHEGLGVPFCKMGMASFLPCMVLVIKIPWDQECGSLELSKCKHLVFVKWQFLGRLLERCDAIQAKPQFEHDWKGNLTQRSFPAFLLFLSLCREFQYIYITLDSSYEFWFKNEMWLSWVVPFLYPENKRCLWDIAKHREFLPMAAERAPQQPPAVRALGCQHVLWNR